MNTEKETKKNGNLPIFSVMWRNWMLPFLIALATSIIAGVIFGALNIEDNFMIGWISCMAWYISKEYYAT